jgi:hypothetical protein
MWGVRMKLIPAGSGGVEFFPELPVSRVQFDAIYQGRRGRAIDINALAIPRPAESNFCGI